MKDYVASSPELQAVLDASVDSVLIINAKGIIEQFNRSAERMFGYTAAEVLGRNVSILMTGGDAGRDSSVSCKTSPYDAKPSPPCKANVTAPTATSKRRRPYSSRSVQTEKSR